MPSDRRVTACELRAQVAVSGGGVLLGRRSDAFTPCETNGAEAAAGDPAATEGASGAGKPA